ncbi:tRNA uridine-5-carboxymethylaminomethyl(34) synthesis GTPase MnmE [uncultured Sphingomonas sp.]|uniref:tRNA uridine-5-carboxymethylaminomethyl(34) synthesis GTPase MnmE n=1 Tax=uncultured Sphingomonas sp. TaxID=158754 RepID=UPI0035CC16F0
MIELGRDTIFALSSGPPPAAIAVVRVSGPGALEAAWTIAGRPPPPRRAGLRALKDEDGRLIDRALVLVFPKPDSATGEDLVELQLHGGRAVVAAVERALAAQGLRRAEAGEFTRRALANGRVDLAQAEGLADLLQAETEAQRVQAIGAVEGAVSALARRFGERVLALSAEIEAALDFADEDDVVVDLREVGAAIATLRAEMANLVARPPVERLRDGIRVVLTGPRNAGKSTLLNLLVQREAAIVSPIAGTTRDVIEVPVVVEGVAYLVSDTAGLVDGTADPVEAIGVERARAAAQVADIVVWLGDDAPPAGAVWVWARADEEGRGAPPSGVDVATASGRPETIAALWRLVGTRTAQAPPRADLPALNRRQRDLVEEAAAELVADDDPLILAERLRRVRTALARITGADATEAMLDTLFGRFCIGK